MIIFRIKSVYFSLILVFCSLCLFTTAFSENKKTLHIYITPDATNSPALSALVESNNFRKRIEEQIGADIIVSINTLANMPYAQDDPNNPFDKDGIIFISDPAMIAEFADQKLLHELGGSDLESDIIRNYTDDQIAGRYVGRQYGIIMPDLLEDSKGIYLFGFKDLLEKAVSEPVDYTPEGFRKILLNLQNEGVIPIAVNGSPAGDGFLPILGLFGLTGKGNGEFILEDNEVVFSKTTEKARDYLIYTRGLYNSGLIPDDFLNITQYSSLDIFLRGKCALTVLYTPAAIMELRKMQDMYNGRIVRIPLPGIAGNSDPNYYKRIAALYPAGSEDIALKNNFLDTFYREAVEIGEPVLPDFPSFELFNDGSEAEYREDPLTYLRYNISKLLDKTELDNSVISPYYAKIVTGEIPTESFDSMKAKWMTSGGEKLLRNFTVYYRNRLDGFAIY